MSGTPGHPQRSEHRVTESPAGRVTVTIDGRTVADSDDVIRVDEDGAPPRYYFSRDAVKVDQLDRSAATTTCPFKGTASYYTVTWNGRRYDNAIWSYEEPYDERVALKGRMAFYDDQHPRIRVVARGAAASPSVD